MPTKKVPDYIADALAPRARLKTSRGNPKGRPTTGLKGEAITTYPRLNVKIPPETLITLDAMQRVQARPIWKVIAAAVDSLHASLTPADRKLIDSRKRTLAEIQADRTSKR